MSAKADQPSISEARAPEQTINYSPPLEQRAEFTQSIKTDSTADTTVKVQDNKIEIPTLNVNGWQGDGTTGSTSPQFLAITNPYETFGLQIAGRQWQDGTSQPAYRDGTMLAQAAPPDATAPGTRSDRPILTLADVQGDGTGTATQQGRPVLTEADVRTDGTIVPPERAAEKPPAQALGPQDVHNKKIFDAAKSGEGERLWKGSSMERQAANGKMGGAISVSNLLQKLGYDYARSANVSKLTNSMISNGWQLTGIADAKPGDIIFGGKQGTNWRAGGGNARVGVVGEDGKIYYNNPETGKWTAADKNSVFGQQFGDQVWALRPPAGGPTSRPARETSADTSVDRRRQREQGDGRQRQQSQDANYRDYRDFRGRDNWSGRDDGRYPPQYGDATNNDFNPFSILKHAIDGIGEALWAMTPFRNAVRGGRLGCAASVSKVLQRAGYDYAHHAGVGGLESQLMRNGWTKAPLSAAGPGDVVMIGRSRGWRAGGGSAHVGIVGENGVVYHNSSSRGQWIKDNLQARFGGGIERFVLKPPANGRHNIDPRMFVNQDPEVLDVRGSGRRHQQHGGDDRRWSGGDDRRWGRSDDRPRRGEDRDWRSARRGYEGYNPEPSIFERMFSREQEDYSDRMGRRGREGREREREREREGRERHRNRHREDRHRGRSRR